MGSVCVDDIQGRRSPENGFVDLLSGQPDGEGFRSFNVNGIASETITRTGMREEILLLSWLIVLLRIREEGSNISFDWAYKSRESNFELEPVKGHISLDEVTTKLQNNVGEATSEISKHIAKVTSSRDNTPPDPVSILLSTSSLSQTSEEAKDEVSE